MYSPGIWGFQFWWYLRTFRKPMWMFKWKKPYVMLIFGESTWALDDFHSQRSSPSTEMLRQLPGKCGGNVFQILSTWAAFTASGLAYQLRNGQVSAVGLRWVDTKGQLEFNAGSGHPVWLITGGEKLASSKQVLGLNLNLYFGQFLWRPEYGTGTWAHNRPVWRF